MTASVATVTAFVDIPSLFAETWRTALWGRSIGQSNLVVANVDGSGNPELIVGASVSPFEPNRYWHVIRYQPATASYVPLWSSATYPAAIARIIADDLDGKGDKIFVATVDGQLYVYKSWPVTLLGTYPIAPGATGLTAGDLDGDGTKELVVATANSVTALSGTTYAPAWRIDSGGVDLAVGQLDADRALEIAIAATPGLVIDGVTKEVQWSYPAGFGVNVDVANIDSDKEAELVTASAGKTIAAFDVKNSTPLWDIAMELDIATMRLIDTDGDGRAEVVTGDQQWGAVRVLETLNRTVVARIENPEHGVTDVNVGDLDGDGRKEIVWGAGHTSNGPSVVVVGSIAQELIEWYSTDFGGPLSAVAAGDVDADGRIEIVVATFESASGYTSGQILVFDAATHALEWQSDPIVENTSWSGIHNLRLAQLDRDEQLEIVVASDRINDGTIEIYDGITHNVQRAIEPDLYARTPMNAVDIADVDGDGPVEIVAGLGHVDTDATSTNVLVFDPETALETWRSPNLDAVSAEIYDVHVADVDGDRNAEIIASIRNNRVVVFDGSSKASEWISDDIGALAINTMDTDDDGVVEILVGTTAGEVRAYDGQTHSLKWNVTLGPDVAMIEPTTTRQGRRVILVAAGAKLWAISPTDGATWGSVDNFLGLLGNGNHVAVHDADKDGMLNVVVGDANTVREYSLELTTDIDLHLAVVPNGAAARVGQVTTLDVTITNVTPNPAENIIFTLTLPRNIAGVTTSLGAACTIAARLITCNLHDTLSAASVAFNVQFTAQTVGAALPFTAEVSAATTDKQPLDNVVTFELPVIANEMPVSSNSSFTFDEDTTLTRRLRATDAENDPLTFTIVQNGVRGSAQIIDASLGTFSYTPLPDANGDDSFTFVANDGYGASTEATIKLSITPVNDAPVATEDAVTVASGATITVQVLQNDIDSDGDPLQVLEWTAPTAGSVTANGDGTFSYTASSGFLGADSFEYVVSDGQVTRRGRVTVTVNETGDGGGSASPPPSGESSGGGGGSIGLNDLITVVMLWLVGSALVPTRRRQAV